ncbi:unnamed protein product [Adineta steineri]|uniref:ETS domain-containing protein n=1 Tax=Adineta steineri TaxID=433720 RepID=A0A815C0L3_9BILA|nr:unnamed protein product [Adineta steineri]CAF1277209.1 unnamed protein product [Adineta steineri]
MLDDQMDDTSSTGSPESLEALFEYIDALPSYPINFDDISFVSNEWLITDELTKKIRPPKLYEFLRLLLDNLFYISYASWLNKDEGLFKIHKPLEVAELWAKVRGRCTNNNIDYDKFSRSIRYYYEEKTMIPTRTKYTYRFANNK